MFEWDASKTVEDEVSFLTARVNAIALHSKGLELNEMENFERLLLVPPFEFPQHFNFKSFDHNFSAIVEQAQFDYSKENITDMLQEELLQRQKTILMLQFKQFNSEIL